MIFCSIPVGYAIDGMRAGWSQPGPFDETGLIFGLAGGVWMNPIGGCVRIT
jgi:hypothetical protein